MRDGDLVLALPGVVVLPDRAQEWTVRARAATLWARGPLSHLSALAAAGLTDPLPGPVHVTVPAGRYPRGCPAVVVHRTTLPIGPTEGWVPARLPAARRLVDAWGGAHSPRRNTQAERERPVVRHLLIAGVGRREVRVDHVRAEVARQPVLGGRVPLLQLLDLVEGGCQSELEVFGVTHVLRIPAPVQQHRVVLPTGRHVDLDAAYVQARVAVELDGAAFHGSSADRERDTRRDTALAALGWSKDPRAPHRSHARVGPLHGGQAVVRRRLGR
ncbi:hypothetical protein GCM10028783_30050 [Modestobacter muralis]